MGYAEEYAQKKLEEERAVKRTCGCLLLPFVLGVVFLVLLFVAGPAAGPLMVVLLLLVAFGWWLSKRRVNER